MTDTNRARPLAASAQPQANDEVVVIGAGVGGLMAAALLAHEGLSVTVLEKNPRPGGRAGRFSVAGFDFDMGPTLLLLPSLFRESFGWLGESFDDLVDIVPVDPRYRLVFADGTRLDMHSDADRLGEQLDAIEPGARAGYARLRSDGARRFEAVRRLYLADGAATSAGQFRARELLKALPELVRLNALRSHFGVVSGFFEDPRLRAAFTFQNMYMGVSPFEAPATFTLLQEAEVAEGVWHVRGGIHSIVQALEGIALARGVRFAYETPATGLEVGPDRAVAVVTPSGAKRAGAFIVNADLAYASRKLLPQQLSLQASQGRHSSSAIMFHWVATRHPRDPLLHHTVFIEESAYRESFTEIFQDHDLPAAPSFYVCAPERTDAPDPFLRTHGGGGIGAVLEPLTVLVPVGHLTPGQDWARRVAVAREAVLERLAAAGWGGEIVREVVRTPVDLAAESNLHAGAAFGLSHTRWQMGPFRPAQRHPAIQNLYFAGASTQPGSGLPMVVISGRQAAASVLSDLGRARKRRSST